MPGRDRGITELGEGKEEQNRGEGRQREERKHRGTGG